MRRPRYALAAYDPDAAPHDALWALCADAEHLFADRLPVRSVTSEGWGEACDGPLEELAEPPVRLLGCAPRGALKDALGSGRGDLGHGTVLRLGRLGQTLQHAVEGEVVAWIPSARGRGLVDLALDPWTIRPSSVAGVVWDIWWWGRPTEPNLWARHGAEGRAHWLAVARRAPRRRGPTPGPGATYHLDGRHITDEPAFYCALGEALDGPGGYAGRDADTLQRCLHGGTGAVPPFTLVWHDARVARTCLGVTPRTDGRPPCFEELLGRLALLGVEAVLA
ncbi:barstar family protein [Streptomyces luteocolor]|uniref:barstar family protein n=1 Tax=Streptomyces luteocolor TaxID=285500 RepID=UPI0008529A23|nr:barstar family protein [Streptomyces luteocolor]